MDREIEDARVRVETQGTGNYHSGHLMCQTSLWGIAGFAGCAYFSWISLTYITGNKYEWPHDLWTAATYVVWILLLGLLAFDTHCLRERIFFVLLVINFLIGCGLTLWHSVSSADVRYARIATGTLWSIAALVSLTTIAGGAREK
jgi:hypothetical protein